MFLLVPKNLFFSVASVRNVVFHVNSKCIGFRNYLSNWMEHVVIGDGGKRENERWT